MKIVYYLPSLYTPGGLERVITFKANYFAEHFADCEVTIITSEQAEREPHFALSPKVRHIDLDVAFDYPFNQSRISKLLKYPYRYLLFKRRLTQALRDIRPDITISTLRRELTFINNINDGSVKIGEFHVTRHAYGVGAKSTNPLMRLTKRLLDCRFAHNLSRLSQLILLTHEEELYWPELKNTRVIPNPIITPCNRLSDCEPKQVIAAGRYEPQKGFDLLIESWGEVVKSHPEWRTALSTEEGTDPTTGWQLKIYGDGGMREGLEKRIRELGIEKFCTLCHTTPDIAEKYSQSSIFVLSSRFEGFGMVIIEAMACGVPAVSFACPCGPRDIITDGVDGLLAESGDTHALAQKISQLIDNDTLRREMGRRAKESSERYKMENIALLWHKLFTELIQTKRDVVR